MSMHLKGSLKLCKGELWLWAAVVWRSVGQWLTILAAEVTGGSGPTVIATDWLSHICPQKPEQETNKHKHSYKLQKLLDSVLFYYHKCQWWWLSHCALQMTTTTPQPFSPNAWSCILLLGLWFHAFSVFAALSPLLLPSSIPHPTGAHFSFIRSGGRPAF